MGSLIAGVNWLNLTTVTGLAIARAARCEVRRRGPYFEAIGYRYRYPLAGAFTVGSVVIARKPLDDQVWSHEVGHIRQYAWCGPMFLPLYGFAASWSWLRTGDWWSHNVFEQRAGLSAGGYVRRPVRRFAARRRGGTGVVSATA